MILHWSMAGWADIELVFSKVHRHCALICGMVHRYCTEPWQGVQIPHWTLAELLVPLFLIGTMLDSNKKIRCINKWWRKLLTVYACKLMNCWECILLLINITLQQIHACMHTLDACKNKTYPYFQFLYSKLSSASLHISHDLPQQAPKYKGGKWRKCILTDTMW